MVITTQTEEQTARVAADLADEVYLKAAQAKGQHIPILIELRGTLGAGKTTFAKGFISRWLENCGEKANHVTSPSFPLAQVYGHRYPVAHLDLFRLQSAEEFEQMGGYEYLEQYSCVLIEWLEKIPGLAVSTKRMVVDLQIDEKNRSKRIITRDP